MDKCPLCGGPAPGGVKDAKEGSPEAEPQLPPPTIPPSTGLVENPPNNPPPNLLDKTENGQSDKSFITHESNRVSPAPEVGPLGKVDIGLQTDLEEDPDIFYIAGGRHVGSQTDYYEPFYGPLTPITFNTSPVILVWHGSDDLQDSTDSTNESVASNPINDYDENEMNCNDKSSGFRPTTPSIETKSSATQLSAGALVVDENIQNIQEEITTVLEKIEENAESKSKEASVDVAATTPNTPSKSTFAEKAKNGILRQNQNQAKSVSSYLNKVGTSISAKPNNSTTTTTSNRSKVTVAVAKNPSALRGTRPATVGAKVQIKAKAVAPIIPNYRSNIASRCRTAVNTGQPAQPSESKVKAAKSCGLQSSSSKSSTASSSPPSSALASLAVSTISNSSGDIQIPLTPKKTIKEKADAGGAGDCVPEVGILSTSTSTPDKSPVVVHRKACADGGKKLAKIGGIGIARKNISASIDIGDKEGKQPLIALPQPQQAVGVIAAGPTSNLRQGITRSKSMINPPPAPQNKKFQNKQSLQNGKGSASSLITPAGSFKKLHSNSYISLPDETSYRRRSHTVDEDGWETVKARSSRSKWSSSNSSLGSSNANQSRNSIDKGTPQSPAVPSNKNKSTSVLVKKPIIVTNGIDAGVGKNINKSSTTASKSSGSGNITKSKEVPAKKKPENSSNKPTTNTTKKLEVNGVQNEDESSVDEEEIKKKEADLDDAIREEELIEEELRQVEKDFERIENDSTTEATDSEHAPSPDPIAMEELDDQFFFVSMDKQATSGEDLHPRESGRILTLREKLMSPAKKCDGAETLKRYEAKLAKAERNREKLLQAKFNRYVELSERFEALNETTQKLVSERADLIAKAEERRKRAAEKRQQFLKSIKRKAHDEDSKAKEIAFINLLEAENKRHDYFASAQEIEERLQSIQEERRVKLEERAAKASLVIDRQSHIRKNWQSKLKSLQEKRRKVDERIKREKEERAKERTEMAQEKARDREERISALNAAKQAEKEELKKKIRQKQEDTARRHEENMKCIRQKAIELGTPRIQEENAAPTTARICTLCKVIVQSEIHEMQHVRGRAHLEAVKRIEKSSPSEVSGGGLIDGFGLKFIADVPTDKIDSQIHSDRNRYKAVKKHSKKLMQKLMESGLEFEKLEKESKKPDNSSGDINIKSKTRKNILELERLVALFANGKSSVTTATNMDRIMGNIRKSAVQNLYIKDAIIGMNGFEVAFKVAQCNASDLPIKTKIAAIEMIHGFIVGSLANGLHILRGTGICTLMNLCAERWNTLIPDDNRWLCGSPLGATELLPTDQYIEAIAALLQSLLTFIPDPFNGISKKGSFLTQSDLQAIKLRTFDIIGYLVSSGVIDRISIYCGGVRGPVDNQPNVASLLTVFLDLLVVLVYTIQFCWGENATGCIMTKKEPDGTQLLAALEASELAGAVSMSYSLLLHQGAPTRPRTVADVSTSTIVPPPPGNLTAEVVKCTLCLINAMARLDLLALQNVLGSESVSLQFRHIASQLLWQVVPHRTVPLMRRLLTELIISIGNFTVGNLHNQKTIQSGQNPTVLQLLCSLPTEYFTDNKLKHNFFATLLAATQGCNENREILIQNNIDVVGLENYLHSEEGKTNVIIRRMICVTIPVKDKPNSDTGSGNQKGKKTKKPLEESNNVKKCVLNNSNS